MNSLSGLRVMLDLHSRTKRPKVLILDDEPADAELAAALLEPFADSQIISDPTLLLPAAHGKDLIILDIGMEIRDGFACLSEIRGNAKTKKIPTIFVTGRKSPDDHALGLSCGADDYLVKPIHPHLFIERIKGILKKRDRVVASKSRELEFHISMLTDMVTARDRETGQHLVRTRQYVQALVHALHNHRGYSEVLTDEICKMIVQAAPLHDIGKIAINDSILRKPGKLTNDEFRHMQEHALKGAALLQEECSKRACSAEDYPDEDLKFFEIAMEMAYYHHECWNGAGYPSRKAGIEIPLCARIMAIADVFDALTSFRVYKQAMTPERAMEILAEEKGKKFDPELIDILLSIQDEYFEIARDGAVL